MNELLNAGETVQVWLRDNPPPQGEEKHVRGEVVKVSERGLRLDTGGNWPVAIPNENIALVENRGGGGGIFEVDV